MNEIKKLYRSNTNKVFAGICGGVGEYFEVDPTLLRLVWLLIVIFSGIFPGVITYLFALLIVPKHP
ncbi:MAG TPA: PspC domain-containing protein [Candidatus Paceibacterota bacterium]